MINHLVMNQKLDSLSFLKYMLEYSYTFPDSKLATHWNRYRANLRKNIGEGIPTYKIEVPRKYDKDVFERSMEAMEVERKQ